MYIWDQIARKEQMQNILHSHSKIVRYLASSLTL